MSVRSVEDVKVSRRIAMVWSTITMMSAVVVGVLGSYYFEPKLDNAETVFIALAQAFYHPLVAGLIIAGIVLAAIMSTIDSQLLVCSTTISEDLYKTYLHKNASDKEVLLVARLGVIAVALIGLAFNKADQTSLSMVAPSLGVDLVQPLVRNLTELVLASDDQSDRYFWNDNRCSHLHWLGNFGRRYF
ncbi:hypothetical protein P4S64_06325 [Vibrio sp. M60_M31a]